MAILVTALSFLFPGVSKADILEKSTELGLIAGFHLFPSTQNVANQSAYGARLTYNFSKNFGLEGAVVMIGSRIKNQTITGGMEGAFRSPTTSVDLRLYHLDGVFYLKPKGKVDPYITAGFGGAHYRPVISTKDMAVLNVGVGAKYWMQENVALRFDLKDYLITELFQESFHNLEATVGISFSFGGKAKPLVKGKRIMKGKRLVKAERLVKKLTKPTSQERDHQWTPYVQQPHHGK